METHETSEGALSGKGRLPLDVRIVARLFYIVGGLVVLSGVLLCSGVIKPRGAGPVLFGTVVLTNGVTQGVYALFQGLCCWFLDWGLRRGVRLVWWFLMVPSVYYLIRGALLFPDRPIAVTIGTVAGMAFIAWLWFRRELYAVHLASRHTKK
jgi:hypothetical protein